MSLRKDTVLAYFDGFRRSDHDAILALLTEDVVWDLYGHRHLQGKQQFDGEIENEGFEGSPELILDRLIEEDDTIVVPHVGKVKRSDGAPFAFGLRHLHLRRRPDLPRGVLRRADRHLISRLLLRTPPRAADRDRSEAISEGHGVGTRVQERPGLDVERRSNDSGAHHRGSGADGVPQGIADRATLDYLGAVLGEKEIEKVSTHRQRLELDLGSRTYSKDFKRLAAPDRVRQPERDTALLVYGNIAPAWVSLRPWYRDRGLRAQVAAAPAPVSVVAEDVVAEDVVAEDVA